MDVSGSLTSGGSQAVSAQTLSGQLLGGSFASIFAAALNTLDLMQILQFCDARYPQNLISFYSILSDTPGLIPNPFSYIHHDSELYISKRYQFAYYEQSISFLDNSGSIIVSLGINIIQLIILKAIVKLICKGKSGLCAKIFRTMLEGVEWNGTIGIFLGDQATIVLSFCLQFMEPVFSDAYGIVSFVAAIISFIAFLGVYILSIRFISWNWNITRERLTMNKKALNKVREKQDKFQVLWKDFAVETTFGRYYLLVWLLRNFLMVIILYAFPQAPLTQSYLLVLLSIFFTVGLCIGKPFNRRDLMVRTVINELILLAEEVLVVVFATNRRSKFLSDEAADKLGIGMISLVFACLGFNALFLAYSILAEIYESYKNFKRRENAKKKNRKKQEEISLRAVEEQEQITQPRKLENSYILEQSTIRSIPQKISNNSELQIDDIF